MCIHDDLAFQFFFSPEWLSKIENTFKYAQYFACAAYAHRCISPDSVTFLFDGIRTHQYTNLANNEREMMEANMAGDCITFLIVQFVISGVNLGEIGKLKQIYNSSRLFKPINNLCSAI